MRYTGLLESAATENTSPVATNEWVWKMYAVWVLMIKYGSYLHERNKDATEMTWCVWLNVFLQRCIIGCGLNYNECGMKGFKGEGIDLDFYLAIETYRSDRQSSWLGFPRCSSWPGSRLKHVHLSLHPGCKEMSKNSKLGGDWIMLV